MLSSCGNSSRGDSSGETYSDETSSGLNDGNQECLGRFDDGDFDISGDNSDEIGIRLTGIIETCNKCMGYGMVQDGMYGQPEICKFCWVSTYMRMQQGWTGFNGCYGQVDAVFNTLPADYFDELDWNPEGEYENNGLYQYDSMICTFETLKYPLNTKSIRGMIESLRKKLGY